ncbi:MAG: sigma-70 family RNA polymerase sigma factor [Deltaproteobacteria bacterium]|nr:sigma-70 family RNA polymerase sigma factor [Deltaproteobacteria bacterium]
MASQRNIPSHLSLVKPHAASQAPLPQGPVTLDSLYRQHAAFVARLALRLLGREADVDDVVHDVFIDLSRQLATLENPEELRGWLTTVTVRASRRRLRRARLRFCVGLDTVTDYEALVADTASPEQTAFLKNVYHLMNKLPADQRLAWTLRHIEGETLETVALRCEMSLATAKRKIASANERLRKGLAAWIDS